MKPGAMPKIRAELIADATTSVATLERNPDLVEAQPVVAHAQRAIADSLPVAGLFLVAQGMTSAAVDAARDVPPTTLLEVWPEQTAGIMAFEGGLPVLDVRGTPVRPEVMTWCHDGHNAFFQLLARTSSLTGPVAQIASAGGFTWFPVVSCQTDLIEPLDLDDFSNPNSPRCVSLALATWILMTTPTVADTRAVTAAGPRVGAGGRRDVARPVKVVELRRLAHKRTAPGEADGSGRVYTHRWVVRGHWRQQAHGPGRAQRHTTWVPSYTKGPDDAPFLQAETVFVWRR